MHYRRAYREALRSAFSCTYYFADFTQMTAWAQNIDLETLPVYGVATPNERKVRDSLDSSERTTTVMVALKRAGGDELEDLLDDDSVAVEQLVLDTIDVPNAPCSLDETSVTIDGGGKQRVGTLIMTFTVTAWRAEPLCGV